MSAPSSYRAAPAVDLTGAAQSVRPQAVTIETSVDGARIELDDPTSTEVFVLFVIASLIALAWARRSDRPPG